MRSVAELGRGLFGLAVLAAAAYGVWSVANPDRAKAARDRAVRTGQAIWDAGKPPQSQDQQEETALSSAERRTRSVQLARQFAGN